MPPSTPSQRSIPRRQGPFRLVPLGDSAITIEFGNEIDPLINARVVAFAATVAQQGWKGILDIVPTYRSVTIHFDALHWKGSVLAGQLNKLPRPRAEGVLPIGTSHTIPVLYGGEWGPDLEDLATFAGLTPAETIRLHTSIRYRVYMLGFSLGFPYLGLVPERLAMPRLPTPRTNVPAGSVGIADRQTGIYPSATPGGWRLIGRTPLSLYRTMDTNPCLLKPGDLIQFEPIKQSEFQELSGGATDAND